MKLYLWSCVCVALFVSCSSKEEQGLLRLYKNNVNYHKYLQKTEKTELKDSNSSMAIVTATYIYTPILNRNDNRDEVFIVGVLFENSDTSKILFNKNATSVDENEYTLTLEGKNATKVTHLNKNDSRLKNISFITTWGEYYEVAYPHSGKIFTLVFENSKYGKQTLPFSKVSKFVYTKKGFK